MSFPDRQYEIFAILGDPEVDPLWIASRWQKIATLLDPAVHRARNSAAVRSTQVRKRPDSSQLKAVSFGRIGWNDKGHAKWTHPDSTGADGLADTRFINVEVWAPSWSTSVKEKLAPDFYFAVRNERSLGQSLVAFNPVVIIAVATDQGQEAVSEGESIAKAISDEVNAAVRGHCVRPWGRRVGSQSYADAINDLCVTGLFKPGPRHQHPVSLDLFADRWEPF